MVALAAVGGSIQPPLPTMPPYTPLISLSSPPATKRLPEQTRQRNFRIYSIFRNSGTKFTVAHHQQSNRHPDHDHITPTATSSQPGSLSITPGDPSITPHTNINRATPHNGGQYPPSTTTWKHTPTSTQLLNTTMQQKPEKDSPSLNTNIQQKPEKDSLSFTFLEGTAHNLPSTTIRPHPHHHHDHLSPSTMPWLHSHNSAQSRTKLTPTYHHPVPNAPDHPHPRYDMTATIRRHTCKTTPTSTTTWITSGCQKYSEKITDPTPDADQTTEPNPHKIPNTPEISDHHLHSPNNSESSSEFTHSSTATTFATASSPTIRHDLSPQPNQALWDNYHAIQKQIANIQATLQSTIDLLQHDRTPDATTRPHPPSDRLHLINCDIQTLTDTSEVTQTPTILLFNISTISSLLPHDPINILMTAHHWSNRKRSTSQSPFFDFLPIPETMPDTYLPGTPTDILHKLWQSNLVLNPNANNVWPSIWQNPNTHISKVLSPHKLLQLWYDHSGYYSPLLSWSQSDSYNIMLSTHLPIS